MTRSRSAGSRKHTPLARVADPLGVSILDLLREDIPDHALARITDRLRRLELVLDAVPDFDAGQLLRRLESGGDLYSDFEGELKTYTRRRLREKLRKRAKKRAVTRSVVRPLPAPAPPAPALPAPDPPAPQPPGRLPPPPKPVQRASRRWHPVGQYIWKTKKPRRVASFWIFDVLAEVEVETTASVNATDSEVATVKAKWVRGTQAAGEVELQFGEWFLPDVKVEKDDGKFTVSFKKEAKLAGGKVVLKPHLQLSTELVKIEVVIVPFKLPWKFHGFTLQIAVEPKVNIIFAVDKLKLLEQLVK